MIIIKKRKRCVFHAVNTVLLGFWTAGELGSYRAEGKGRLQSIHRSRHRRLLSAKCKQMKSCVKARAPRVLKGPTIEVLLFSGGEIHILYAVRAAQGL